MENIKKYRTIFFFKSYFDDFYQRQRTKVKDKILWIFRLIETLPIVPELYLKHIEGTDDLYEIRIQQGSDIFRVFCFFDVEQLVIIMNGFHKKTNKTPKNEIAKALKIKEEYEKDSK
ncbi:MAG: type II toxin-antitoxin system RelE/ParE family toxin [Tannerella sp.]|jgi:phage-related protein|nr:type II toxin-antitoxin system RelE/ParE family toxin [Tannerella sp.]